MKIHENFQKWEPEGGGQLSRYLTFFLRGWGGEREKLA